MFHMRLMQNVRLIRYVRLVLASLVCAVVLLPGPTLAGQKATLVLQWLPQAQFAGYYMAAKQGFYSDMGIDLTILPGGPDVLASEYLEGGRADFATMFLSTGLARWSSLPIVNIGQIVQHSALMLITKKSSGIERIDDLNGRKVGLWANEFQVQPRTLFDNRNMTVTIVPQSDSLSLFMRGGVVAASGMWYNEYHTLMTYGMDEDEIHAFRFSEFDLDFPEDGIYCLESTFKSNPDLCSKLVKATIKGWLYAFGHREETLDEVLAQMKAQGVPANRAHQRWMLERMEDIIVAVNEHRPVGILRKSEFERTREVLLESGFIKNAPSYDDFYKGPTQ